MHPRVPKLSIHQKAWIVCSCATQTVSSRMTICTFECSSMWGGFQSDITSSTARIPKLYTSGCIVTFLVRGNQGAMYPSVPAIIVVNASLSCPTKRARLKSARRAFISESKSTLLGLMSLCRMQRSQSSCKYDTAAAHTCDDIVSTCPTQGPLNVHVNIICQFVFVQSFVKASIEHVVTR